MPSDMEESFAVKHPGINVVVGLLFYAVTAYGLMNATAAPSPKDKAIWYGMTWLPAILIFWSGRRLGWSVLAAGLLALAGPAIITWVMF